MPLKKLFFLAPVIALFTGVSCTNQNGREATKAQVEEKREAFASAIGDISVALSQPQPVVMGAQENAMARHVGVQPGFVQQPRSARPPQPASNYLYKLGVRKRGGVWRAELQATSEWDRLTKEERVQLMKDLWLAWSNVSGDSQAAVEVFVNGLTPVAHADTNKPKYAPDGAVGNAYITVELRLKPGNRMGR
jgi:DNA-binding transcriptional regulator YdaS (Cro superfamily)